MKEVEIPEDLLPVIMCLLEQYRKAKDISYIDKPAEYALEQTYKNMERLENG